MQKIVPFLVVLIVLANQGLCFGQSSPGMAMTERDEQPAQPDDDTIYAGVLVGSRDRTKPGTTQRSNWGYSNWIVRRPDNSLLRSGQYCLFDEVLPDCLGTLSLRI